MHQGGLSCWRKFTRVPSHGSKFVYMILQQNFMVAVQVTWREFTWVVVPGQEILQRYHVNAK